MFKALLRNKKINKLYQNFVSVTILNSSKRRKIKQEAKATYRNFKKKQLAMLIKEKYSNDYCIFSRYGIGDVFFVASLLKEFKKYNPGRIIYFTEKKHLVKYLRAFPSIDEVVFDKELKFLQEEQTMQRQITKGCINKLFFPYRGNKKTFTFSDNYNNLLNLQLTAERELPVISTDNIKKADVELKNLKLDASKTVLIIPDATMFDYRTVDLTFWNKLVLKLKENGYDIVFNTKLSEFKKFKNTYLPVLDFIAFAQKVKYIISFRSGISDLLAGIGLNNMSAIYPPELEVIWADAVGFHEIHKRHVMQYENEFQNMFNIHSLNNTFKGSNIDEIIYNYDDDCIIKKIIERINNV